MAVTVTPLTNDSDVDGDTLVVTAFGSASNGSVSDTGNGTALYTPNADFVGSDSFTYDISDGNGGTATGNITVSVGGANDAPVVTPDAPSGDEDTVIAGVVTATDADNDAVTFSKASDPTNGTVTVAGTGAYTYTPNANFNGQDSFDVLGDDGKGGTDVATVTVTVNPVPDAPQISTPGLASVPENRIPVATIAATDGDGDAVTYGIAGGVDAGAFSINGATGALSFLAPPDYETPTDQGGDNIYDVIVSATDGSLTTTLPIAVTVTDVFEGGGNPQPSDYDNVFIGDETDNPIRGTALNDWIDGMEGRDNINGKAGDDFIIAGPGNDWFVRGGTGSDIFQYSPGDGDLKIFDWEDGQDKILLTGGLSFEEFSVVYRASTTILNAPDGGRIMLRGVLPEQIDAGDFMPASEPPAENFPPSAQDDAYAANSDQPLVVSAGSGVLSNDSDADGDLLSAVLATGTANGSVTLNPDGSFSYTPNDGFAGTDGFTYTAQDGNGGTDQAAVTIAVSMASDYLPSDYDNQFYGDAGPNPIMGTALNDWIEGGDSRDNINGKAGDDYIIAGPGNDWFVRGGTGADIFEFGLGDEGVKIYDFENGVDLIRLVDGLTFADLAVSSSTRNGTTTVEFRTDDGDRLLLHNQNPADIDANDFFT